ncbi:site-specific DNA-methyltransferase [Mycoplasmopsis phocirhinis]|uniref:site-specific DNA-methyltransferase n=1 Tax=Mycoplasmopsis phocirhinis TaxID=142650 RepID=UPI001E31EAC4|nr:site-specific DNA-methyltransferase [Mycoplasmopsis phocirhinis]
MDPPYNTESAKNDGNNSANDKVNISASKFIYRDKFSRNGWLNMMNERLNLAKKLLKEDGVIFVSIDDNEQAYLKVLMDEIFGEENFVTSAPFISNLKGRQANTNFALTHEYVLIYKGDNFTFEHIPKNFANNILPNVYNERITEVEHDEYGEYVAQNELENSNSKFNVNTRPKLFFTIYINKNKNGYYASSKKTNETIDEVKPRINSDGVQLVWRWQKSKIDEESHNLKIELINGKWKIKTKKRNLGFLFKSLILGKTLNTENGNDLLYGIIDKTKNVYKEFTTAKPIQLLNLLFLSTKKNARVLDFFAGSGTTGHAVLELNKEDGGNRTFTLVTNNENNIGYGVTYERLYRINNGLGTNNETFEWLKKNQPYKQNLNVFELEYSPINIDQNQINTQYLIELLKHSLLKFGVSNTSEKDLINNLTNLYSLDKE